MPPCRALRPVGREGVAGGYHRADQGARGGARPPGAGGLDRPGHTRCRRRLRVPAGAAGQRPVGCLGAWWREVPARRLPAGRGAARPKPNPPAQVCGAQVGPCCGRALGCRLPAAAAASMPPPSMPPAAFASHPSSTHTPPTLKPACSQDKLELPDGRHRIEWCLIDEHDDAHLAVVGARACPALQAACPAGAARRCPGAGLPWCRAWRGMACGACRACSIHAPTCLAPCAAPQARRRRRGMGTTCTARRACLIKRSRCRHAAAPRHSVAPRRGQRRLPCTAPPLLLLVCWPQLMLGWHEPENPS